MGCHSSRSSDLSVNARNDSTGYVRLMCESREEDDKLTLAAISQVKFGKKAEEAITDSRDRTPDTFFTDVESVALAIEGSDVNITEDSFVPAAKCIQDTKERQLVTRSGLQRLRCCVCHLHHEQAMEAPYRVRQFFRTVLQQVHRFKVDVIAGEADAAAYKNYQKQEYQDLYNSWCDVRSIRLAHLKADVVLIIIQITIFSASLSK